MSVKHYTEAFIESGTGVIGWQCFDSGCGQEKTGFSSIVNAERDADLHTGGAP